MDKTDPEFHDIDKAIFMDFPVIDDTLNKVSIGGDTNPVYQISVSLMLSTH